MSQKYGGILTVWLGMKPTIVMSNHERAWEVLVNKSADHASRMLPYMSKYITANWMMLFSSDHGPYWQSLHKGVQGFAMNPSSISSQTLSQEKEAIAMTQKIQEQAAVNGRIVHPIDNIRRNTIRVVGHLCFGPDFNNEAFVVGIDPFIDDVTNISALARFADAFPFIRYIPGLRGPFRKAAEIRDGIVSVVKPEITRYQSSKSPCTTCYLHFLLSNGYPMETIIFTLFEMFMLSIESTSTMTAWALAFLLERPNQMDDSDAPTTSGSFDVTREMIAANKQIVVAQALPSKVTTLPTDSECIIIISLSPLLVTNRGEDEPPLLHSSAEKSHSQPIVPLYKEDVPPAIDESLAHEETIAMAEEAIIVEGVESDSHPSPTPIQASMGKASTHATPGEGGLSYDDIISSFEKALGGVVSMTESPSLLNCLQDLKVKL
ncbi:(S)-canadine synthase CYP719A21-like [Magnolia sinica]|uniref:(S)-canadine synthase CYP719A21-like n=1 Tax=Magnolia sinica TaxID=86752 RepID=UPI00265AD6C2|nr:(S)-canadine synthase CYP719A21-like [Magnolia sinica]